MAGKEPAARIKVNKLLEVESPALIDYLTEAEDPLAQEIVMLGAAHRVTKAATKRTRVELRILRRTLGEKLHAMQIILAHMERDGGWDNYLRAHSLPRASVAKALAYSNYCRCILSAQNQRVTLGLGTAAIRWITANDCPQSPVFPPGTGWANLAVGMEYKSGRRTNSPVT